MKHKSLVSLLSVLCWELETRATTRVHSRNDIWDRFIKYHKTYITSPGK